MHENAFIIARTDICVIFNKHSISQNDLSRAQKPSDLFGGKIAFKILIFRFSIFFLNVFYRLYKA